MSLAEEIEALDARRLALEAELDSLRAQLAREDDAGALLLWPTSDPDRRQCRGHAGVELWVMFGGLAVTAAVLAGFDNRGSLMVATLAAAVIQFRSVRTVIDRRSRTFARRLAWSPRALVATEPIGRLEVRKHVKRSKGQTTTTYEVVTEGRPISDGHDSEAEAAQLKDEIEAFLDAAQTR